MDFINRGFSSLIGAALIFIAIMFLFNMLPVILLIGAAVWGTSYIVKSIRKLNFKREKVVAMEKDFPEDFSVENAIDVEYTEIK